MSLLGIDDPRTAMLMGLASGLLTPTRGGQFAPALQQGLLGGMQGYQTARQMQGQQQDREMRQRLAEAQLAQGAEAADMRKREFGMQEQRFAAEQAQMRAAQERQQRQSEYLQQVAAGKPINASEAFAVGLSTADAKALAESGNWGRSTVKTWKQVRGPDGKVVEVGLDEFGQPVQGAQQTPFIEPKVMDLGGKSVAYDPAAVQPGQAWDKTMTPGEAASNAIARGNLSVSQARLGLERQRFSAEQGAGAPLVYNADVGGYIPKQLTAGQMPTVVPLPGGQPGKPPTEFQSRNAQYAAMMKEAENILTPIESTGAPNVRTAVAGALPFVGAVAERGMMSKDQQRYRQAQETWVRAKLRLESGAAIGKDEMEREIATFFPMVGDTPPVIAQKRAMRQQAIAGMSGAAGPAVRTIPIASQSGAGTGTVSGTIGAPTAPRVLRFDANGNMIGN